MLGTWGCEAYFFIGDLMSPVVQLRSCVSLQPHGLQHARLPCLSLSPRIYSNSCPLSQWCHQMITSSVAPSLPAHNLSQHPGLFQWVDSSHRWPKYWSFSCSISPSNKYSGLISFWIDWLDLFTVQGTPKRLLQNHSSKASILWYSTFFMFHLSYLLHWQAGHFTTSATWEALKVKLNRLSPESPG